MIKIETPAKTFTGCCLFLHLSVNTVLGGLELPQGEVLDRQDTRRLVGGFFEYWICD